ncbi:MAG: type II CRISPR-associated endonuclease Cas1 [Phycisphaerales bacterium]|nr:type II CRISPR-associated endonuclease Cas1 [Phycisphaerales bacterium]
MQKRTLYFASPAYLQTELEQLCFTNPHNDDVIKTPIEDIAMVVLDHPRIKITHCTLNKFLSYHVAMVICNDKRMPAGLLLPFESHTDQTRRFHLQVEASEPLKKNLWQQLVVMKIHNQASLLKTLQIPVDFMLQCEHSVSSGDQYNNEAVAAAYYWRRLFKTIPEFKRERFGNPPNMLLNYGYTILRSMTARALVMSGLHPTFGIHHHNKYNAYCLADDLMEPYRPFVDKIVCELVQDNNYYLLDDLTVRKKLLAIPLVEVMLHNQKFNIMTAIEYSAHSLASCFLGDTRKLNLPCMD